MMKKSRIQLLYALLAFIAAEGIQLVIVYCFQILYGRILGFKVAREQGGKGIGDSSAVTDQVTNFMSQDVLYIISVAAVLMCGIFFFFWYHYEISGEIRGSLRNTFTWRNIILLTIAGIACQFFITCLMNLVQQYFTKLFEDYSKQMEFLTGGNDIVVLSLMILIAPITEELIFRGVILHKAERAIPHMGANILQAMLFGIYHMNVVQGIYAACIGFILGSVHHKFKTILAPIMLHMIINISSLLVVLVPKNYFIYAVITIIAGVILSVALNLLLTVKSVETHKAHPPYEL